MKISSETKKIRPVKKKSRNPRFLTSLEVNKLLASCDTSTNRGIRDLAILMLLLYLGLQVGELVKLRREDVISYSKGFILTVSRGTSRNRFLHVPDILSSSLNNWLEVLEQFESTAHCELFCQILKKDELSEQSINTQKIRRIVSEYGYRSGLNPRNGNIRLLPTDLRRTCGSNAYNNGARLLDVQAMLGDTRPISTARFIDVLQYQNAANAVNLVNY